MEQSSANEFHHPQQSSSASYSLLSLHEMQQQGQLCDVVLEADSNNQIVAHRAVLAASSPYFKAMFVNNMRESSQRAVRINDIDFDILQAVVAYAYNAEFYLPRDRVLLLMITADLLQMTELRQECSTFLEGQLHPCNCLSLRSFAGLHNCTFMFELCTKYALDHFEEVIACDEYLHLPSDQLKDLISKDDMRIAHEEEVYSAVLRWVYHDLPARRDEFPEIMSHVRLPFVSSQFLSGEVEQESLIRNEEQCQFYIQEAYLYKKSPEKRPMLRYSPRSKPRKPSGLQDVILTAGGMCKNSPLSVVEQYDLNTDSWAKLCHMDTPRFGLAVSFSNGVMYAIGGYNDQLGYLSSVECYRIKEDRWSKTTPMLQARR